MAKAPFDPRASLDELLHTARSRFGEVEFQEVGLSGGPLEILQIRDMTAYIDKIVARAGNSGDVQLPLWAKIWPGSVVLSMYLERCPLVDHGRYLEIGAGVGLAGLILARRGVHVTLTDVEPNALLFCRINALRNGLEQNVDVVAADFTRDRLEGTFDGILGGEVLFRQSMFEPLGAFLGAHLAPRPDAEIVLSVDSQREGIPFFKAVCDDYAIMRQDVPFSDKESGEQRTACLYRMRRKS